VHDEPQETDPDASGMRYQHSYRALLSFAAVRKHVALLERAGLIKERPNGREQLVSTNLARLERAGEVLDHFESIWRQRMAQLDDVLLPTGI
jgi:DNA-binding transcriptional ArsR family regulator